MNIYFVIPDRSWLQATGELVLRLKASPIRYNKIGFLFSYYFFQRSSEVASCVEYLKELEQQGLRYSVFLDSGAFSAHSVGKKMELAKYAKWVRDLEGLPGVDIYANLDVIGDPLMTLRNQRVLEMDGLNPLPVVHRGSQLMGLDVYNRLACGGLVGASVDNQIEFVKSVMRVVGRDCKIHVFGVTGLMALKALASKISSADSSSWMSLARWGHMSVFDRNRNREVKLNAGAIGTLQSCGYPYTLKELQDLRHNDRSLRWRMVSGSFGMYSTLSKFEFLNSWGTVGA